MIIQVADCWSSADSSFLRSGAETSKFRGSGVLRLVSYRYIINAIVNGVQTRCIACMPKQHTPTVLRTEFP